MKIHSITQFLIDKIVSGKIAEEDLPRPVVIMHDITRTIINDTAKWNWKVVIGPDDEVDGKSLVISRQEADALIDRYGLVKQYENGKLLVFDTPDKEFYHTFHRAN